MAIVSRRDLFLRRRLGVVFQLLLTTRLLRRFGIGPCSSSFPHRLLGRPAYSFGEPSPPLYSSRAAIKSCAILSTGPHRLLYLPLPNSVKLQAKWFIDTVVWRVGTGSPG